MMIVLRGGARDKPREARKGEEVPMLRVLTVKGAAMTQVNPYNAEGRAILETATQIAVETYLCGKQELVSKADKMNLFTRLTGVSFTVLEGRDGAVFFVLKGIKQGLATPWAKLAARMAARQDDIRTADEMAESYATLPPSRMRERFTKQVAPSLLSKGSGKANFATKAELEADPTFAEIVLPILKASGMW